MNINFHSEGIKLPSLNYERILLWLDNVAKLYEYNIGDINVIFTSSEYILKTNNDFLKHNYYTDIITFDYSRGQILSGDIFICPDVVKENALYFNSTFEQEIHRVIVHGLLHLIGFDDSTEFEQNEIRELEDKALSMIGL